MEAINRGTQQSTINMEIITRDMQEIARKTKQETVSMRIITFVTLCFLPGTFISVSPLTEKLVTSLIVLDADEHPDLSIPNIGYSQHR